MAKTPESSWDSSDRWYGDLVGEKGHHYHQAVILPNLLNLFALKEGQSLLDLGCGSGVLARNLPKGVDYVGIDSSKGLLDQAKKLTRGGRFVQGDATQKLPIDKKDFDRAVFILSLQNMEDAKGALSQAKQHLKKGGKLALILNHPSFRIPRQSGWGVDETAKLQYRRINTYMSPLKIPIQTHPGQGERSATTYSFHRPLSLYSKWLYELGFSIELIEEWCSDKKSEGGRAKMEDRARKEIPLFMAILATG
jgi:SAM-dependent methyltransferase